jgi:hypothetical protein
MVSAALLRRSWASSLADECGSVTPLRAKHYRIGSVGFRFPAFVLAVWHPDRGWPLWLAWTALITLALIEGWITARESVGGRILVAIGAAAMVAYLYLRLSDGKR